MTCAIGDELSSCDFGDERLTLRVLKLASSICNNPETSINAACGSFEYSKGAYRFFQNEKVRPGKILASHIQRTLERIAADGRPILAIQDTTDLIYGAAPSFTLAPFYDLVPCLLYTKDPNELGLKLGGKNSRITRGNFDELAAVMKLDHAEIPSFIAEVREKRQLLIDLMRAYELGDDKIRALTDLAAQRIQVIEDKSGRRAHSPMAESAAESQATGTACCRSMPCKNPNGPTELRGRRKISGICSYCEPEAR